MALTQKLRTADPDVRAYVKSLESENKKLHRKVVSLELDRVTNRNRIAALEKEIRKGIVRVTIKRFSR